MSKQSKTPPPKKLGQDIVYYFKRGYNLAKNENDVPPKIYNHNFTIENDLTITFPLQSNQIKPISINQLCLCDSEWGFNFNSLVDIIKLDSTGYLYKEISKLIYNNPKANELYFEFSKNSIIKKVNDKNETVHLIMIDKDGSINIDYMSKQSSYTYDYYNVGKFKFSSNNSNSQYSSFIVEKRDSESVLNKFIKRYLPNNDLTNYDKVKQQTPESYSYFDGPKGTNSIPSYKQICFSTLKELYSVGDKIEIIKKIKSLPFDLQFQFIQYCSQLDKPIGCDIILHLYKEIGDDDSGELKEKLFPLQCLIKACLNRDTWYRSAFSNLDKPNKPDILINVFENIELFKFKELNETNCSNLLFKGEVNRENADGNGGHLVDGSISIVKNKEEFLKNFNNATNNMFKDKLGGGGGGNKFIFYGGLITSCLMGSNNNKGFEHSDIDILMLANEETGSLDESEYIKKVTDLFGEDYEDDGYSAYVMGGHVVFTKQYPNRPIQFNVHTYRNLQDVLLGVDMDCTCFAFDGENVWTLQRGVIAMNHRINIASEFSYRVRGENQYQRRLLKYVDRGFSIYYQNSPTIEKIIQNFKESDANEFMIGFELLLAASHSTQVLNTLKTSTKSRSFPYGPEWKKENFDRYMKQCFENVFDGYSSSGVYCPLEDLEDMFRYLESPVEQYQTQVLWDLPNFSEQYPILKRNQEEDDERFDELPPIEQFLNLNNDNNSTSNSSKSLKTE